jgi:hypothetical protein
MPTTETPAEPQTRELRPGMFETQQSCPRCATFFFQMNENGYSFNHCPNCNWPSDAPVPSD